ncbi:hypothetical protein MJG53_002934, partial [Ovis ammon polii x Ovis aries]
KLVTVEKQDNGTFGFEIQTYRLPNQNTCSTDMCTLICKIQEDSPAHCAGLQAGDATNCPSLENMDIDEFTLLGPLPGPALLDRNRLSSASSCKSWLSSMTIDSEDGYQTCVSEDSSREAFSRQTSTDDECFVPREGDDFLKRSSSRRNRSISSASSGSMSPLCEGNFSGMYGTLPRKSRRGSVRKQLLKFIPGLHHAVEEEESRF